MDLLDKRHSETKKTEYGMKHVYKISLEGKKGKTVTANVLVAIQKDNGRITHKIVTVYPDKKWDEYYE